VLLLVKKRFADAIRDGSKTLEIRAGSRYRNLRPGDSISINGHFRKRLTRIEQHVTSAALIAALRGRFHEAGFANERDGQQAIRDCYPREPGVFFVLHLS
jgi:ASC-1-like (ASCH) protein